MYLSRIFPGDLDAGGSQLSSVGDWEDETEDFHCLGSA